MVTVTWLAVTEPSPCPPAHMEWSPTKRPAVTLASSSMASSRPRPGLLDLSLTHLWNRLFSRKRRREGEEEQEGARGRKEARREDEQPKPPARDVEMNDHQVNNLPLKLPSGNNGQRSSDLFCN